MSVSMTTSQIAVILGVRPETVRKYIRDGKLLALKDLISGQLEVSVASLAQFIKEQQLLGEVVFAGSDLTTRKLSQVERDFTLLVALIASGLEESELSDQTRIFELAWFILSTRFIPEWAMVGKKARGTVLRLVERVSGNPKFGALELAFLLYESLWKEQEKILV